MIDKEALERILELEAQLEDAMVTIDLQQEEIVDLQGQLKASNGQLNLLRQDRRVEVAS